jgi:uncharacterized protein (DUF952 family)
VEILHLAEEDDWLAAAASGEYAISTRGASLESVGFIHASTREQLPEVARFVHADNPNPLVVIVMELDDVREAGVEVLFEDGGNGQRYPHLYGPIRPHFVRDVLPAWFDADGELAY